MAEQRRNLVSFPVPPELQQRAAEVIRRVREDSTPRAHLDELIAVIIELTHTGLHSYFLTPLERIGVGALPLGVAKVGVVTAGKGLPTLVRRVVGGMDDRQLKDLVELMDEMMVEAKVRRSSTP